MDLNYLYTQAVLKDPRTTRRFNCGAEGATHRRRPLMLYALCALILIALMLAH